MIFQAKSDENRELNLNWKSINTYVSRWKPHTSFEVEIKRHEPTVSDPFRRWYFGVCLSTYGEYLGYDKDEMELLHRQLKIVFFQLKPDDKGIHRNVPSVFGNKSDIPMSMKKKFVDWVVRCAAKDGCYIEMPNENGGKAA